MDSVIKRIRVIPDPRLEERGVWCWGSALCACSHRMSNHKLVDKRRALRCEKCLKICMGPQYVEPAKKKEPEMLYAGQQITNPNLPKVNFMNLLTIEDEHENEDD